MNFLDGLLIGLAVGIYFGMLTWSVAIFVVVKLRRRNKRNLG